MHEKNMKVEGEFVLFSMVDVSIANVFKVRTNLELKINKMIIIIIKNINLIFLKYIYIYILISIF